MILLFLIMRCTPTIRELIEATPLSLASLDRLPASRLLLPRSGLERSDFVHWHETDMLTAVRDVRSQGQSGKHMLALSSSQFDPQPQDQRGQHQGQAQALRLFFGS
jgi:hypothetical protein